MGYRTKQGLFKQWNTNGWETLLKCLTPLAIRKTQMKILVSPICCLRETHSSRMSLDLSESVSQDIHIYKYGRKMLMGTEESLWCSNQGWNEGQEWDEGERQETGMRPGDICSLYKGMRASSLMCLFFLQ